MSPQHVDNGSLRAHPGHVFEGFELVARQGEPDVVVALCDCGTVLDEATAVFTGCPECDSRTDAAAADCIRCGGSGRVIDHAALQWRPRADEEVLLVRTGARDGA